MKKMLNIIAVLTTSLTIAFGICTNVTAVESSDEKSYDINDEEYRAKVDSLGEKIPYEEEFVAYLNKTIKSLINDDFEDRAFTHVYNYEGNKDNDTVNRVYCVESIVPGTNKRAREFECLVFYWGEDESNDTSFGFSNYDEVFQKYSVDEMNTYLKEQNLEASIVNIMNSNKPRYIVHYDNTSEENIVATFLALNEKYGAELLIYPKDMESQDIYYEDSLLGDVNLDGKTNVRDAAFIAKAISHREMDLLKRWADYNNDNSINIRDAAAIAKSLAEK